MSFKVNRGTNKNKQFIYYAEKHAPEEKRTQVAGLTELTHFE